MVFLWLPILFNCADYILILDVCLLPFGSTLITGIAYTLRSAFTQRPIVSDTLVS